MGTENGVPTREIESSGVNHRSRRGDDGSGSGHSSAQHCAFRLHRVKIASMKHLPTQLVVGLGILLIGGGIVGGEYLLVKWYPKYKEAVKARTLAPTLYKNDEMGIELRVAAGLIEKAEPFPGGVRIFAEKFLATGPSLTITSQPNPDKKSEFTPQELAIWQTDGVQHNIWRYDFQHTRINDRDAVLIWQYRNHAMLLTARIAALDEALYLQACEESMRTIKVAGPPSPEAAPVGGMEILPGSPPTKF